MTLRESFEAARRLSTLGTSSLYTTFIESAKAAAPRLLDDLSAGLAAGAISGRWPDGSAASIPIPPNTAIRLWDQATISTTERPSTDQIAAWVTASTTATVDTLFVAMGWAEPRKHSGLFNQFMALPAESQWCFYEENLAVRPFTGTTREESNAWIAEFHRAIEAAGEALRLAFAHTLTVREPLDATRGMLDIRASSEARYSEHMPATTRELVPIVAPLNRERQLYYVRPPSGVTLALPFDRDDTVRLGTGDLVPARRILTGAVMRAYLASWALWARQEDNSGLFQWDMKHVLFDLFQVKPAWTTVKGKRYARCPSRQEDLLEKALNVLLETKICGVRERGDRFNIRSPEALINEYEGERRGQGRERFYVHAPMLMFQIRKRFVHVPLAVMRLHADDVPTAVGIATVLRERWGDVTDGPGHVRLPLPELAAEAGEDTAAGARREGRAYWSRLATRLGTVVKDGELGELHVTGEGEGAVATLEPSAILGPFLSELGKRRAEAIEANDQAEKEATVRRKLGEGKRRPGRPRKRP